MHRNDPFSFWFVGVAIVAVIVWIIVAQIRARKRTQALQVTAQEIGFTFGDEDWEDQSQAPQLETALFDRGHSRKFDNVMSGSYSGFRVSLFDYSFTTGGGKSSHTWTQTVAAFTQELSLPDFALRPEGFFDRIGEALVHKDIHFDSHPDFSHRYHLRGSDPEKIRELFSPALLTFCEGLAPEDKWHIEGNGTALILYRSDATVNPVEVRAFLDETSSIASSFFSCCGLRKSA
jgi:hypothetical protein